ncbi:RusA family crossover junction endodeoxyribonuclease [Paenibacillus sp. LjRoot56]|uniref:RusA family crossover junction endodeoxyribonuclease n=1 Tax=Paenibacillus sp. LjRoot56 TaxID=3342333 RepID=UPI003ECCD6DF
MQRAKLKEQWESIVRDSCWIYGIQPVKRVSITLEFYFPDKRRRDLDNYAFAFKFIGDALVKLGILPDDSTEEVVELRVVKGGISKPKHINIHLVEV